MMGAEGREGSNLPAVETHEPGTRPRVEGPRGTSKCHEHNHPEIMFDVDARTIPESDIRWLIESLEKDVASGTRYEDGHTMQVGWLLVSFVAADDGSLRLQEPNMQGLPISFVDGVTNTLRDLRQQKDVVLSLIKRPDPVFTALRKPMVVSKTFEHATDFYLLREPENDHFSGWYLRDLDDEQQGDDDFDLLSVYELGCKRPELIKFLALPPSYAVHAQKDGPYRILLDAEPAEVRKRSYLASINDLLALAAGSEQKPA
jgi:hypothetical protein